MDIMNERGRSTQSSLFEEQRASNTFTPTKRDGSAVKEAIASALRGVSGGAINVGSRNRYDALLLRNEPEYFEGNDANDAFDRARVNEAYSGKSAGEGKEDAACGDKVAKPNPHNEALHPLITSPFLVMTNINLSVLILVWHIFLINWNLSAYIVWIRHNNVLLRSSPPTSLYLVFLVIGQILLYAVLAPLLIYAAKYVERRDKKNKWLSVSVITAFFWLDVPFFFMDTTIYYNYSNQRNVITSIACILRFISFILGVLVVWLMWLHLISDYVFVRFNWYVNDLPKIAKIEAKNVQRALSGVSLPYQYSNVDTEEDKIRQRNILQLKQQI